MKSEHRRFAWIIAAGMLVMGGVVVPVSAGVKGACCRAGGTCTDMSAEVCAAVGGTYRGDGTQCVETDCAGACCFVGTGSCSYITETRCRTAGGTYQGDGINCVQVQCATVGACCRPDGSCVMVESLVCRNKLEGVYQGNHVECAEVNCPPPPVLFACCLRTGVCLDVTVIDCEAQGGQVQGRDCKTTSCTGACCFIGSNTCVERTRRDCRAQGGLYQGDGAPCFLGCNQQPGACCSIPSGDEVVCTVRTQAACVSDTTFIAFAGSGTTCFSDPCVVGACCFVDQTCALRTETSCLNDPCEESFAGDGVGCDVGCAAPLCQCDIDGSGTVDFTDLLQLISTWGPCLAPCPADADGNGDVGFSDLLALLTEWGASCGETALLGCP